VKLRVRDAVLAYLQPRLEDAKSPEEALAILRGELTGVETAAASAAEGRRVRVSLGPEDYPARDYGSFTLPAGRYESLRIILGEGEGHNWWCVVFPPLCGASAADLAETAEEDGLDGEDVSLITGAEPVYVLKFRSVELWERLRQWLGK
jgi:stage II sporulation protein R